jgi:transposase
MSFESEIKGNDPLSLGLLAYFRERQRNRIHEVVLSEFLDSGMTKTQLAKRMGRSLSRVTKWLAAPGNWEMDTVSDFLLAIRGAELEPSLSRPFEQAKRNYKQPDWIDAPASPKQEEIKPDPEALGLKKGANQPKTRDSQGGLADQLRAA